IDAAVIDAVAALVGVAIALVVSLLPLGKHHTAAIAIGSAAFVIWAAAYFVVFWSTTGQTPGGRLMQIRVVAARGGQPGAARSLARVVAMVVALIPLGLGMVPVLLTPRRRGLHDWVARTVVVTAPAD